MMKRKLVAFGLSRLAAALVGGRSNLVPAIILSTSHHCSKNDGTGNSLFHPNNKQIVIKATRRALRGLSTATEGLRVPLAGGFVLAF